MKHVQASQAKAKFAELLDQVEQGETVVITRHGKVIAQLVPDQEGLQRRRQEAVDGILELRKQTKPVSVEEILAWKNEGRR